MEKELPKYGAKEELFNVVSHAIGIVLSIAGLILMVSYALSTGNTMKIVAFSIYGVSLILLYTASTVYHSSGEKRREIFNKLDHSAIYLLIAGSYTPFTLITLPAAWGWSIFGVIWACAIGGIIFKLFFYTLKLRKISAILYLVMGWMVIIVIKPLYENLSAGGLLWLGIGGLFYSGGVFFYLTRKVPFNHGIWHLFVLAGSIAHFIALFLYVL